MNKISNINMNDIKNIFKGKSDDEQKKEDILAELKKITDNKTRVKQLKDILSKYRNKFYADDRMKIDMLLNSLEKKYTDKTNEYINYDKNMQNYLKNFAETEEIEKAKQIEQERMENTLNAYVNQLNSRNPHEHNHKKQRRGEMLKFY